jgi:hypothetical protein
MLFPRHLAMNGGGPAAYTGSRRCSFTLADFAVPRWALQRVRFSSMVPTS